MLAGCDPAPTTTITAKAPKTVPCGDYMNLTGKVDPPRATPEVILQRTVNGKWTDWLWYETNDSNEDPHRIRGGVDPYSGEWWMNPRAPYTGGRTYSLRVRSAGGSVVSNTVWVTTSTTGCPSVFP